MKKIILFSALALILSIGVAKANYNSEVSTLQFHSYNESKVAHNEKSEESCEEGETPEVTKGGGSNMIVIMNSYCKEGVVEYSDWSACNKNFGTKGFQFRQLIRPTLGNCLPTALQQADTVRDCQ